MLNKKKIILYLKVILFTVKNDEIDKQANEKWNLQFPRQGTLFRAWES